MKKLALVIAASLAGTLVASAAVTTAATASVQDLPVAIQVISRADISDGVVQDITDLLQTVPDVQSFRYGDNPRGVATLPRDTNPGATPDYIGAAVIRPGAAGYASLVNALENEATLTTIAGHGVVDTNEYAFFIASRAMPTSRGASVPSLTSQIDFVIGFPGMTGWIADAAFPGDTWQGGSLVASTIEAGGLPLDFALVKTESSVDELAFDGAVYVADDWVVAAVDTKALASYGGTDWTYGFASHTHAGEYGDCNTCESIVTAYPSVPRTATDLYHMGDTITLEISGTESSDDDTDADDNASNGGKSEGGASSDGSGSSIFGWLLLLAIIVAIVWFVWKKRGSGGASTPRECEPKRKAWASAKKIAKGRADLVATAKANVAAQEGRIADLKARKKDLADARKGPSVGTSGGVQFAKLDGELIKVADLKDIAASVDKRIKDETAKLPDVKARLAERQENLKEAKATEAAAKKNLDACLAEHSA